MPVGAAAFAEALRTGVEIFHTLKRLLEATRASSTGVGDEGGFAPVLGEQRAGARLPDARPSSAPGYRPGEDVWLALDAAAQRVRASDGRYVWRRRPARSSSATRWSASGRLVREVPDRARIEDGLAEDDCEGWELLTRRLGGRVQLVGDDLFVTNPAHPRRRAFAEGWPTRSSSR